MCLHNTTSSTTVLDQQWKEVIVCFPGKVAPDPWNTWSSAAPQSVPAHSPAVSYQPTAAFSTVRKVRGYFICVHVSLSVSFSVCLSPCLSLPLALSCSLTLFWLREITCWYSVSVPGEMFGPRVLEPAVGLALLLMGHPLGYPPSPPWSPLGYPPSPPWSPLGYPPSPPWSPPRLPPFPTLVSPRLPPFPTLVTP